MHLLQYAGYCDEPLLPYVEDNIYIDGAYYLYMSMAELAIKKVYLKIVTEIVEKNRICCTLQIKKNNEEIQYNNQEIKEIQSIFTTCRRNETNNSSIVLLNTQITSINNSISDLVTRARDLEKLIISQYGNLDRNVTTTALRLTFY